MAEKEVNDKLLQEATKRLLNDVNISNYITQANTLITTGEQLQSQSQILTKPSEILYNAVQNFNNIFKQNNLTADIKQLTSNQKTAIRQAIIQQDYNTIYEILQHIQFDTDVFEKYKNAQNAADSITKEYRNNLEQKISIFLKDGYTFLTSFGELIRGSQIIYEVTVTVDNDKEVEKRTGYFSLQEILEYTNVEIHRGTYTLRLNTSKLKANEMQRLFSWSEQAQLSYNNLQNLGLDYLPKINQGQLIEGFRDASDFILNFTNDSSDDIKQKVIQKLQQAYSDRTRFFQGGDIIANIETMFNIFQEAEQQRVQNIVSKIVQNFKEKKSVEVQEKGESATFTSILTILNNIKKVRNSLTKIHDLQTNQKAQQSVQKTTAYLDKRIESAAKHAVLQFLAKS